MVLANKTKGGIMATEIKREELETNELLKSIHGDHFIFGDKVETTWWYESQKDSRKYVIQFADNTEIELSRLQLFSILNDYSFQNLNRERWTIGGIKPKTWKGTVREKEVTMDASRQLVFDL
tara:strand:- start:167 stop:532 length:366 start_codon:yes stop_codon:yes gene_type:complete